MLAAKNMHDTIKNEILRHSFVGNSSSHYFCIDVSGYTMRSMFAIEEV